MIYTNNWMKLEVGKGRYGFMLGEDGMVMDDGVTIRLAEDHFFMHTTTGGAAGVLAWMERWLQTEWPEMEVFPDLGNRSLGHRGGGRAEEPRRRRGGLRRHRFRRRCLSVHGVEGR